MLDDKLKFSDAQTVTTTEDSDEKIDLGALTDDRGTALAKFGNKDGKINLVIAVVAAPTAGTSIQFALEDSANDTNFAATEILTGVILIATLVAGYEVMNIALPNNLRRFLKIVYTVDGTTTSTEIDAYLAMGIQQNP